MKRRLFVVFLIAIVSVGFLFAGGSAESSGGRRPIVLWYDGTEEESFKRLEPEFEAKYPELDLQLEIIPYDNLSTQELVACQSSSGPDIMWQSYAWTNSFARMGLLESFSPYLAESEAIDIETDFNPVTLELGTVDGEIYGLPWSVEAMSLVYNKDMFREAGLDPEDPPETWAEMIEYAQALTKDFDGDGVIDQYGFAVNGNTPGNCWFRFVPDLWAAGGNLTDDDMTKATLDTPEGLEALKYYTEFLTKYKVAPESSVTNNSGNNRTLFINKRVAMYIDGQAGVRTVQNESDIDVGICLWPGKDGPTTAGLGGYYLAMPKNAEHKEDAWTFIEYFLSEEVQSWFPIAFPANLAAQNAERFNNYRDEHFREQLDYTRNFPPIADTPTAQTIIMDMIQAVLSGMSAPEDALAEANSRLNECLTAE